jgi:dolichol-phosphate mannosyltransferase
MKHLSLVIPVYNEERNIVPVFEAVQKVMQTVASRYAWDVLFVDDGSKDRSVEVMKELADREQKAGYLELSRNFGKEIATTAGLRYAKGDGVLMLDADLQHPPERILDFLTQWEQGFDIVIGIRTQNQGEGIIKRWGSKLYYKLMGFLSETELIPGETDFRLIDRKVISAFNEFTERNRMTRALLNWLGFKRACVYFVANARHEGVPSYNYLKLVHLAVSSFISHSLFPLKIAGYLGMLITFTSGLFGLFIFWEKYLFDDKWNLNFSGPAILAVINLFLVGIVLACLGLVALYVGNIHNEVANRPIFVIRNKKIAD